MKRVWGLVYPSSRDEFRVEVAEVRAVDGMIAYCGLDCRECDAYLATVNNDWALREKTAKLWAKLNDAPILPEHINCQGCRAGGVKTVFCEGICAVRRCALGKGVATCGECPDWRGCPTVGAVLENSPSARENLKG